MKIKFNFLFAIMAIVLMLAACGTTSSDDGGKSDGDKTDGSTPPAETIDDGKDADVEQPEDESDEDVKKEDAAPETEDPVQEDNNTANEERPETIVLSYTDGENEKEKEAQLTKSDAQDYSVYVLPTYQLTSEEPGRDSLYFDDGSIFMRIETIVAEEDTYTKALENTLELLEASSDDKNPEEITDVALLPSNEGITNAKGYSLSLDAVSISGLVFERDGIVVKLTIFDTPQNEHYEAFLRMAETIMKD